MISQSHDHHPDDYLFLRGQRRYSEPLEPTDGLSGWGHDLLSLATVAALVGLLWFMCAVMAQP